jgi:hypothetical protein
MTTPLLDSAVQQVQALVGADGARLDVVDIAHNPTRVSLKLELVAANCADCVLPPSALLMSVSQMIRKQAGDESIEIVIDDPRTKA